MPEDQIYDYVIVGQGLAGSVLAYQLLQKDRKVLVVDPKEQITSSKIAAGVINPVTGKRFVKSWMADTLIPYAKGFYRKLERKFSSSFFHELPVFRLFGSLQEQNEALARAGEPSMKGWLQEGQLPSTYTSFVNNDFGGIYVRKGGWLDVQKFIATISRYFQECGVFINARCSWADFEKYDTHFLWQDYRARQVIFCEGDAARFHPLWNWLPFVPAKGELLTLAHPSFPQDLILNRHSFLLPIGNAKFRFGATYQWNDLTKEPTEEGREELMHQLTKYLHADFTIEKQYASVRPTVKDRRPILGPHPHNSRCWIFNGLGTKGAMLAPYFSHQLIDYMENQHPIHDEVDIARFLNKFKGNGV